MATIQYFAYGSNMLTRRLRARCPSATVRLIASADNYALAFSKVSRDGSGKATLRPCPQTACRVFGVVFDLNGCELPQLDRAEGVEMGYDRINRFQVHGDAGPLDVVTYLANDSFVDVSLKPYDWYLDLVVAGAREHRLPVEYVASIEETPSASDPVPGRPSRLEALNLLGIVP